LEKFNGQEAVFRLAMQLANPAVKASEMTVSRSIRSKNNKDKPEPEFSAKYSYYTIA